MLNIEPSSIDFGSIEPGSLYVVTFSVRNVGKVAQRIRLQAPKSSIFALNYVPTGVIAPGLDLRAEVECLIPKELHEHVFSDKVVAFMGDEKVEIPITAAKPHLKLDYPTTLNLGNLQLNQSIVKEIQFQNLSHVGGSIRFSAPRNSNCKLSSMKLDFVPCGNPGSVSTIKLTMEGKELGHFRECLLFHDLRTNEEFLIEVIAQVIQPVLSIVSSHKGGSFDVASFGNLFFGEKQRIEAFLVNSGPQALSFSVRFEDDDEEKQNGAQSETNDQGNRHLTLFPMDGIVKPYSELAVTFNFSPTLTVPERGFQQTFRKDTQDPVVFKRLAIIECLDSSQSISIPVEGIAYSPHIEVNPSLVRFGDCPVNDRRDVLLTLRNTCQLPYTFSFPAIANFKFTPSSGKILADESVSITASFIPPQLGLFKVGVPIDIQNGLKTFSLKLVGESYSGNQKKVLTGGIDKLPQDFATEFKFVNPEEEAAARREKKLQKDKTATTDIPTDLPVPPPIIAASSESDDIYGTENKVSDTATLDQRSAYLSQMNAFYKQHNARYNEFLRTSAVQRTVNSTLRKKMKLLKSGAVDFSDPFGVNMGMERGLDEPELKLPLANESLFLTSATSNGNAEGGSKGRLPVDENRLIQKKYPPEPATQAQFRDCSSELDQEELKLVTASHKIIDFGKVCVGSVSYKNFVVYNGLKKAIKVTIEDLEIELQQSKPLSQVIPEGSVAGFDICVTSRSIGKLKRSFTWKINNNHSFKVHILAEVVPIELIMNKAELELSFPEDSTKQTLTSEIILTNPGNAYADFLWGSAGAFTCDPEKGSIAPGKSAVISITWDPHSNKRTEEDLGLHVSGGVDQVLKVRGHLPETKAEFVDKRIQLGLMAVGTEKEFTSTIMNTGENPLVIFINNIDAQLGIKVEPTEAFIQPHGSIDLNIVITPKVPRSYDNVIIGAKVRGGKSISIRLNGTSIIPLVDFEPSMFKFGNVTVESVARIPFNISNKSSIAATLILDLTSYGDFAPSLLNPLEILDVSTKEFGPLPFSQEDEAGNHISLIQQKSKGFDDRTKKTQKKKQASNCWKLTIPPNSTMLGEIIFRPTVAKKYSFKLPLQLLGVTEDKSLYRDLTGIAIASVLSASSYVVDFGDKVVSRDPLSRVSYFQETTLTNISQTGVSFIIHEGLEEKQIFDNSIPSAQRGMGVGEPQQIFFVSPLKVDLAPGASTKIRVTFLPQESANYHKRLGIFIKDQDDTVKPYLTLLCIGSGVYPCLSFDSEYIQLPSVPIGITSRAMFTIFNHGYASLEIKHRISPNVAVPLDVSYPDGNQVGIMVESIRVVVSCRLDQSSAWAGKIEFYDMDGERFFLAVGGMSDNCLLSNYWFIKNYSAEYGFIGLEDNPVQFLPVTQIQELRQLEAKRREDLRKQRSLERQKAVEGKLGTAILDRQAKKDRDETSQVSSEKSSKARKDTIALLGKNSVQSDSDSGVEIEHATTGLPEEIEGKFLIKWLNRNFSKRQFDPESFPQCILENQGDWLVEIFEQMCGKKVNIAAQKPTRGIESKQEDQKRATEKSRLISLADKAMFKFQQIINFLINCGALLNHINVIWLLNKEDYLLMLEHELTRDKMQRITPAMLSNKRKQWNEVWLEVSRRSWLEVLYQAIKVFVLSRINFKELCTLPGIVLSQKTLSQPLLTSSRNKNEKLKKSTGPTVPKDMVASNVFTHHEQVLLFWLSYHLERAEGLIDEGAQSSSNAFLSSPSLSFNKRVSDLSTTFTDFFPFCQLFHSHISEIAKKGEPLYAYTTFDRSRVEELYLRFEESCLQYHVEVPSITSEEIMKSNRNLLLLLVHMYLNLPHLIPKTKIEFSGMLGIPISKRIELRNPSKRPLAYAVSLKGSEDYLLEKTEVTVPPESSTEFLVTLNARFSQSVESKIYFWNRRDPNNANGPTLCFQCFSQIKGIQALEKLTRTVSLFEFETIGVTVKNPYNRDIVAKIKIEVKFCPRGVEDYLQGSKSKKRSHHEIYRDIPLIKPLEGDLEESSLLKSEEAKSGFSIDDWDLENMFRQPFWFHDDAISIPKGSSKVLNIFMLPFELGSYICQIVFLEPELGEFCYEIHADVTLPKSGERLAIDVQQGIIARLSLSFNSKNVQFERALSTLTESRIKNANKKIRARSVITNFLLSQVTNEEFGYCNFLLDFTVPVFSFNRKFNLVSEYVRWSSKGEHAKSSTLGNVKVKKQQRNAIELYQATNEVTEASESLINRNILTFSAERAGLYKTIAVIRPDDNPFDIRCVELLLTAKIPDVKMVLEFNGPARTKLSQEIPIHNETDADWSLSVASSGKNFSVPKIVNVPAKQTAILEVSFYSLVTGSYEGKLQLKNPETNDIFEYQLIGVAEDALAEDTLNFRCSARKKSVFSIFIPNLESILGPPKSLQQDDHPTRSFKVETDLPFAIIKESAKIPAEGGNFEFSVNCPMGGELNGYVSFKDIDTQAVFWYAIVVDVTSPQEEKTIEVQATVRQAVVVEITLDNPLKDELVFDVTLQGEGLIGQPLLTLLPGDAPQQNVYELIFSPLFAGPSIGKVSFWNELVGEVWYKLQLVALPASAIEVPLVDCMLGSETTIYPEIENPLNESITFTIDVVDTEHFAVSHPKLSLKSFEQGKFAVNFRPSNFNEIYSTQVRLRNKKLGEIVYNLSGKGLLPGVLPTTIIEGPIFEIVSENILFRNPFPHPLPVEIILVADRVGSELEQVFSLLRKTSESVVPAKSPFHVPISFSPQSLGTYNAVLQIRSFVAGHNLLWCYPIQGLAEVGGVIRLPQLKTSSKSSLIKEQVITLSGLRTSQKIETLIPWSLSDFVVSLKTEEDIRKLVNRSFKIQLLEVLLIQESETKTEIGIRTRLLFEPLRMFSGKVEISIKLKNQGKWKAAVDLEATSPEPDDTIKLTAKVGDLDRISFKLNNRFLGYSPFQAYFASSSSPHFTVEPKSGLLAPYDTDGTTFVVTFAPREYGFIESGILNILTEDTQWTFQVKGAYPDLSHHSSQVKSKINFKR